MKLPKPNEVMEANGAWKKNPQRRRPAPPKSKSPLGSVPADYDKEERKVWADAIKHAPENILTANDRNSLDLLCRLMGKVRRREELKGAELTTLVNLFGRFGMSPADRSRIAAPPAPETPADNPDAEFE